MIARGVKGENQVNEPYHLPSIKWLVFQDKEQAVKFFLGSCGLEFS